MPAGRSQTGLVVQLRRREIEILHRAKEVESWGQDCAFFVRVFYGKERGFVGQPVRAVRCAASGAEWVVLDDGLATTVRLASLANDLFKISELKDVVRRIHAGEIADPSLAAIDRAIEIKQDIRKYVEEEQEARGVVEEEARGGVLV